MPPGRFLDNCPRPPAAPSLRWLLLLLVASLLAACSKSPPAAPAVSAPPPTPTPAPGTPATTASTPCELITPKELRAVFPGVATSTPEQHAAFGIAACEWNGEFGRLLVQQWASKGHTPQDEVRDLVAGFIDSSRPGAAQRVRLVPLQGLGNYATAAVEARDLPNGVLADISVLSISRNGQTLVFLTDALDEQDRDASLARLRQLGRYAYARL